MSTIPEPRESREVPPETGTVGALLRFIEQYDIPSGAILRGSDATGSEELDCFEYRVGSDGEAVLVVW